MRTAAVLVALLCLLPSASFSQLKPDSARVPEPKKWDVTAQHGPGTDFELTTDEGTWMAVDVSPDGKTVAFDLLGDIYSMPITGGEAKLLAGGPAFETQPRFSPDGKRILFTSDRDGLENIWTMNPDGSGLKQITKEKERQVMNAVWTPDGRYIVGKKHYRNTRSLGAGEMWLYHVGGGDGLQMTQRRNWEQDAGEPALSPDGKFLYYSEDVSPGGGFQYNKDPYGEIYVIHRLNRETGKKERFITGAGGSFRPQPSPDGKTIAFVRRVRLNSVLYLYDIESNTERPLWDGLSHDMEEVWAIFGVYPGFSWTRDGKAIVIWAQGKIWKVDVASGKPTQIPFTAKIKQHITDAVRFAQDVAPEKFEVKMLRWVTVAPDQRSVVYQALGKLYLRSLPNGTPKRLTEDEKHLEMNPSFSPDGKSILYTTWNDQDLGAIMSVSASGGTPQRLSRKKGHFAEPSFSHDGKKIVFVRTAGDGLRGDAFANELGVYVMNADGSNPALVTEEGSKPMFGRTDDRIFLLSSDGGKAAVISCGLKGEQRRVHVTSENAQDMLMSPDEEWIALTERYNCSIAPFPRTGSAVNISPTITDYPIKRVTQDAGLFMNWSADSKRLSWFLGPELFSRDLTNAFPFVPGAKDSVQDKPDTAGINISFLAATDNPSGTVALVGATVISMKGDEVLKDATVLIERNRIVAVGTNVRVPASATTVDVKGKYIMPGIVDVHAHGNFEYWSPLANWRFYANLAYGITTMHDPSATTEGAFANSELLKAGLMTGPRLYSTGTILYGAEGSEKAPVTSLEDAMSHLRRMKAVGAFSVKSYNQPRRDQRQEIIEAARALRMMVVPEGGSTFFYNVTHILDGHTSIEHNIPVAPLYKDVVGLIGASKTGETPTLIVTYGGLMGENYWYQNTNVWENNRLLTYTPREVIDSRSRRRPMAAEEDYYFKEVSRSLKKIVDAGGKVQLGGHGQLQGMGPHWELWMLQQGGMTPMQAIRCATLSGAWMLGLDKDLGSLEPGKLADLIVLDKDPLENIRNSESVRFVMKNGRLYDGATMDEIGNHPAKRPTFYFSGIAKPTGSGTKAGTADKD